MNRRNFLKVIPKAGAAMGLSTVPIINLLNVQEPVDRRLIVDLRADKDSKFAKAVLDNGLYKLFKAEVLPLNPYFFEAMKDNRSRVSVFSDMTDDMLEQFDSLGNHMDWGKFFQVGDYGEEDGSYMNEVSVSAAVFRKNDHTSFSEIANRLADAPLWYTTQEVAENLLEDDDLNSQVFNDENDNILHGDGRLNSDSLELALERLRANVGDSSLDITSCSIMHSGPFPIGFSSGLPYNTRIYYLDGRMWALMPQPSTGYIAGSVRVAERPILEYVIDGAVGMESDDYGTFLEMNAYLKASVRYAFELNITNPQYIIGSVRI